MTGEIAGEFFTRNILTNDTEMRSELSKFVGEHVFAAAASISSDLAGYNLYVSGSLGRGEPCYCFNDGLRLYSDIDFVVVGHESKLDLGCLSNRLNDSFPEFLDTVYFIPAEKINQLFSASAYDLFSGMTCPIEVSFPLPVPPKPKIGLAEMLEVVVYQVTGLLSSSETSQVVDGVRFWQASPAYQRQKTVVDILRTLSVAAGAQPTLNEAVRLRHHPLVRSVFRSEEVLMVASTRESWNEETFFDERDVARWLRATLEALLPTRPKDARYLIEAYRAGLYRDHNVLHLFPTLILAEALLLAASPDEQVSLLLLRSELTHALSSLREVTGEWSISSREHLKRLYIKEMVTRKDLGGAIWRWDPQAAGVAADG